MSEPAELPTRPMPDVPLPLKGARVPVVAATSDEEFMRALRQDAAIRAAIEWIAHFGETRNNRR